MEIAFDVKCGTCGGNLEASESRGTIEVSLCGRCVEREREEAHKEGEDEGYDSGLEHGRAETKTE